MTPLDDFHIGEKRTAWWSWVALALGFFGMIHACSTQSERYMLHRTNVTLTAALDEKTLHNAQLEAAMSHNCRAIVPGEWVAVNYSEDGEIICKRMQEL